jgi:hypothetical protein
LTISSASARSSAANTSCAISRAASRICDLLPTTTILRSRLIYPLPSCHQRVDRHPANRFVVDTPTSTGYFEQLEFLLDGNVRVGGDGVWFAGG